MATTRQATFCPKCDVEITGLVGNECPHCHATIKPIKNEFFGSPDYIWHQREALLDECDSTRRGAKVKSSDVKKQAAVNEAFVKWLREMPPEDRIAVMRDAQLQLQHIMHARVSVDEVRQVTTIAKSIGKLAEALENVFRNGGTLHDGKVGQIPPFRDGTDGSDEATR